MQNAKGFTLIELMVSMSISLVLLSSLMGFFLALSKNSYEEVIKLEISQDYLDVASYLRSLLGQAIFQPHCLHPEWLHGHSTEINHPMMPFIGNSDHMVLHHAQASSLRKTAMMIDANQQYPNLILNDYKLKTLAGSDLIEMITLTPLVVKEGKILNVDEVSGASGYLLATDCQSYVLGRYHRSGLNRYQVTDQSITDVQRYLSSENHIQYYKIHRTLLYVSYEKDQYYLIHNFLDGSNHMRFPNVKGLHVQRLADDWQMLNLTVWMPSLSPQNLVSHLLMIRLLNL